MRGRQYGKLRPGCFGRPYPLIGIELCRVEDIIILYRLDAVVTLTILDAVEDMQVIMEDDAYFRLVPLQLMRCRARNAGFLSHCREDTYYQKDCQVKMCFHVYVRYRQFTKGSFVFFSQSFNREENCLISSG